MQTTQTFDNLCAIQNSKVVRVGQHNLSPRGGHLIGHDALNRRLRADGHECRRFYDTMRSHKPAAPRARALRQELIMKAIAWCPGRHGDGHGVNNSSECMDLEAANKKTTLTAA
jgi:hypothetical protein